MSQMTLEAVLTLVDRASAPLRQLQRHSQQLASQLGQTTHQLERLQRQTAHPMRDGFRNATQEAVRLEHACQAILHTLIKVQHASDKVAKHFAKQREAMRAGMLAGAAKLGATGMLGAAAVLPAVNFDKQMSATQAVLNLEKKSAEYAQLRADAISLGASSAFSASEVGAAQFELAAGGFDPKQVHESIKGSLDLAAAGKLGIAEAANIAVGTLNGFGLEITQIGRMNDVMVETTNRTATSVFDLGETMKYIAPISKQYGVSLEQAHAMTGLLGNANIKGSEAGTAMRAMMARLASPPKAAVIAMRSIGVSATDAKGRLKDLPNLLAEINQKTRKLSNSARLEVFSDIAGVEAMSAMAVLVDQSAVVDKKTGKLVNNINALTKGLQGSAGAAAKVAAIQMDNLAGDLDAAKGAAETLSITLFGEGGTMHSVLRQTMQSITDLINRVTAWAKANPELIRTIGSLALKLLMFKVAMVGIRYSFAATFGIFFSMLAGFLKFGLIALIVSKTLDRFGLGFGKRIGLAAKGVRLFASAFRFLALQSLPLVINVLGTLARAALMSPLAPIILAIALVALLIYRYWGPIKAFVAGVWQGFKDGLAPVSGAFDMLKTALEPLRPAWDWLVQAFTTVTGVIGEMLTPFQATQDQLNGCASAGQLLGQVLGGVLSWIIQAAIGFVTAIVFAFTTVGSAIGTMVGAIVMHWAQIKVFFANIPTQIAAFFMGLPAQMMSIGSQIIQGLMDGLSAKWEAVKSTASSIASSITDTVKGVLGIHSPSRVFAELGGYTMTGLTQGLLAGAGAPVAAVTRTSDALRRAVDTSQIRLDRRAPVSSNPARSASMTAAAPITVNIYPAAGMDPQQIAQAVSAELDLRQRQQGIAQRSRLYD